jgi:hypothetical protein
VPLIVLFALQILVLKSGSSFIRSDGLVPVVAMIVAPLPNPAKEQDGKPRLN